MGTVFILLIVAYLFSFFFYKDTTIELKWLFRSIYLIRVNKFKLFFKIKFKGILNTIKAQYAKIKKFFIKSNNSDFLSAKNSLLYAIIIHVLFLYLANNLITFKTCSKIQQNWEYVEISTANLEENNISESAPALETPNQEEAYAENSDSNESQSTTSEGINIENPPIQVPTDNIKIAQLPVIQSKTLNAKQVTFIQDKNPISLRKGKDILYSGKSSEYDGYGKNGNGSGLFGYGSGNGSGGNGLKEAKIFGNKITADKLGVILDVSPSMQPYLTQLKMEIRKNFPNAIIIPVEGCSVGSLSESTQAFCALGNQKVDSIYWFCDLQDPESHEGLDILNKIIKENNIKLYIKSLDKRPNPRLQSIISFSGGSYFNGLN